VGEEDARGDDMLEVLHHLPRLRLDSLRVRRIERHAAERHLPGDENPAVGLHGVAERRDRIGRPSDHVKERHAHCGDNAIG
jgi:hypothetical protein